MPQAVGLTVAVLAVMLVLYRTRVIRVTQRFRSIVVAATGGILAEQRTGPAPSMREPGLSLL